MNITYFEWVDMIEKLKDAPMDDNLLKQLDENKLDGTKYTLHKLVIHILNTANVRISNGFQKFMDKILTGQINNIDILSLELVGLKKEFNFSKRIINLSIISDEDKKKCVDQLDVFLKKIYDMLEKIMEHADSSGGYMSVYNKIMVSDVEE